MLASTVQFSNNNRNPLPHAPPTPNTKIPEETQPADAETRKGPRKNTLKGVETPHRPSSQDPTAYLQSTNTLPARSNSPQSRNGQPPKRPSRRTRHEKTIVNRTSQRSTRERSPQNTCLRNDTWTTSKHWQPLAP
jgi:hypothetical protein